jgi:hypothetical protein
MKKIILFSLLLILTASSFSQQNDPKPALLKENYMQKSKKQKKAAWIMLGGGTTLILTGILIPKGDIVQEYGFFPVYENDGIKGTFILTGTLSMIGSVPFFIVSKKNKRKGMSLSFSNQKIPSLQKSSFVYNSIPSLKLKIGL